MSVTATTILTDNNLQEIFEYPQYNFPFMAWRDDYEDFPHREVSSHWHNDIEFAVVVSGEIDYYLSDRHLLLKKGDCVFVNSNSLHLGRQHSNEKAVMIGVTFQPSVLNAVNGTGIYSKFFRHIVTSGIKGFQIDINNKNGCRIKKSIEQFEILDENISIYELQSLSVLCSLWADFYLYWQAKHSDFDSITTNLQHENNVKKIISYIKRHYMDNFSIEDIAKEAGISRTECFRSFKRFTSKTPLEYILEYRLFSAANLLLSTNDSVLDICTRCGFSSSSYFGKRFKEHFGITPIEFRKQKSVKDIKEL